VLVSPSCLVTRFAIVVIESTAQAVARTIDPITIVLFAPTSTLSVAMTSMSIHAHPTTRPRLGDLVGFLKRATPRTCRFFGLRVVGLRIQLNKHPSSGIDAVIVRVDPSRVKQSPQES